MSMYPEGYVYMYPAGKNNWGDSSMNPLANGTGTPPNSPRSPGEQSVNISFTIGDQRVTITAVPSGKAQETMEKIKNEIQKESPNAIIGPPTISTSQSGIVDDHTFFASEIGSKVLSYSDTANPPTSPPLPPAQNPPPAAAAAATAPMAPMAKKDPTPKTGAELRGEIDRELARLKKLQDDLDNAGQMFEFKKVVVILADVQELLNQNNLVGAAEVLKIDIYKK